MRGSTGRRFLLRIEDLDTRAGAARYRRAAGRRPGSLGIDFDGEPVRAVATADGVRGRRCGQLADQTYECFCSRREIAEAASAPHGAVPRYPGHLPESDRGRAAESAADATAGAAAASRRRVQTIHDVLHGEVTVEVDDFVLRRNDGVAGIQPGRGGGRCCAGIDQVVRGDDLLPAAVNQAYLAELLGHHAPTYAHVPLAVNVEGRRLAKRDGAVTLPELAAYGMAPDAVLGLIAQSHSSWQSRASRYPSTTCSTASILVGCPASHGWSFPPAV